MACAQTGSGKTAAFLFPLITRLMTGQIMPRRHVNVRRAHCPSGLILAPTRELATQIHDEAVKFTYRTGLRAVVVYGGQDIKLQFRELDQGCAILVATPGRLVDFLERSRISLSAICYLCFDEADRMLDMGFEPQIRQIVQSSDMPREGVQTLMFSATFPKEIQRLAQDFLDNYIFLAVGRVGSSSGLITQRVEFCEESNKRDFIMRFLPKCQGLTLIFVERKKSADALECWLTNEGVNATSIHGDRTQEEREQALAMFRCGRCPVLVATDVAARGLDIPNVMDVINYDMPASIDDYVHRIGRTGRCGNNGTSTTLINLKNRAVLRELHDMLVENKQQIPKWFSDLLGSVSSVPGARAVGGSVGRSVAPPRRDAAPARSVNRDVRDKQDFSKNKNLPKQQQESFNWARPSKGGNYGASTDAW
jgi:ATP-dependent RNA helicase DDX3X